MRRPVVGKSASGRLNVKEMTVGFCSRARGDGKHFGELRVVVLGFRHGSVWRDDGTRCTSDLWSTPRTRLFPAGAPLGKTKGKIGFHVGNVEIERPRLRVKRWRSVSMAMRWNAAAMQEAAKGFRQMNTSNFQHYVPPWERTRPDTQPAACLLAKPTQLDINLSSDRFAMFSKERDIGRDNTV